MSGLTIVAILIGLVAVATIVGLVWKSRQGRVSVVQKSATSNDERVVDDEIPLGESVTLLQLSSPVCSTCGPTATLLQGLANDRPGVRHTEVDVTRRLDLATTHRVLQTPTTLILDGRGVIRARIHGAPRRDSVLTHIDSILDGAPHG